MTRAPALVLATLALSGCCNLEENLLPECCVAESAGHCVDLVLDRCSDDPLPPLRTCGGTVRQARCAELGFTQSCGEYVVRPGSRC